MEAESSRCAGPSSSGEVFMRQFILFIDSRGSQLLSSKSPLKLQPRALEFMSQRLAALRDLQRIRSSNPMDFIAGAAKDLGDFKRLEKLQQFLENVKYVKLYSASIGVRDPTPVDLSAFKSLTTVELRGCDLSSRCIAGVGHIREHLEKLICQDSLEALRHLLAPSQDERRGLNGPEFENWESLKHLSCSYNDISEVDWSIALAPGLETLDLSRNLLSEVKNLDKVGSLISLDVSHNRLDGLGSITETCYGLKRLILQGNSVRSVAGIEKLECLETLDLRWNLLGSLKDVVRIARLPKLMDLGLAGNPVASPAMYRVHVLACFTEKPGFVLDGKSASDLEKRRSKRLRVTERGEVTPATGVEKSSRPPPSLFLGILRVIWPKFRSGTRRPSSMSLDIAGTPPRPHSAQSHRSKQHKVIRRVVEIPAPDTDRHSSSQPDLFGLYSAQQSSSVVTGGVSALDRQVMRTSFTRVRRNLSGSQQYFQNFEHRSVGGGFVAGLATGPVNLQVSSVL